MCLIFFALDHHPKYKFILAGNRDEFYSRRTTAAAFWQDHPNVLAGRDLEAMGTWLGVTKSGKVATLTNFRDPKNIDPAAPSRGKLVSDFLIGDKRIAPYMDDVSRDGKLYNGFNLIAGTVDQLWYYSNYGDAPRALERGFYGISNHLLDTPWPKVLRGKAKIQSHLAMEDPDPEFLFKVLYDEDVAADDKLPDTGLPLERERALSSMFIKAQGYGSRSSTVILVDRDGNVLFTERVFDTTTFAFQTYSYRFRIGVQ